MKFDFKNKLRLSLSDSSSSHQGGTGILKSKTKQQKPGYIEPCP
jgi:hypothetical protein